MHREENKCNSTEMAVLKGYITLLILKRQQNILHTLNHLTGKTIPLDDMSIGSKKNRPTKPKKLVQLN